MVTRSRCGCGKGTGEVAEAVVELLSHSLERVVEALEWYESVLGDAPGFQAALIELSRRRRASTRPLRCPWLFRAAGQPSAASPRAGNFFADSPHGCLSWRTFVLGTPHQ